MTDEKTKAAVERTEKWRDYLWKTGLNEPTQHANDLDTILAALNAANERAERECVWTKEVPPDANMWVRGCNGGWAEQITDFCCDCGGKVKGAK